MRTLVVTFILATLGIGCWAKSPEPALPMTMRKLGEVKRACTRHLKTRTVCGCVSRNVSDKVDRGQFNQEQLDDVVMVMKHLYLMGDIFQPRLESMADYLVGLEFHCQKNPRYSVN